MEGDRALALTVKSAALGIIDYREADVLDRKWWRRWRLLVSELADQNDIKVLTELLRFHLACVSNSGLTEDSFKSAQDSAKEIYEQIQGIYKPWSTASSRIGAMTEDESIRAAWKHFMGFEMGDEEGLEEWRKDIKSASEVYEAKKQKEAEKAINETKEIARRRKAVAERRRAANLRQRR